MGPLFLFMGSSPAPQWNPCAVTFVDDAHVDMLLMQATIRGDLLDVQRALTLGASPNTTAEVMLRVNQPTTGSRPRSKMTPLMRACELGHEDADLEQCDYNGWNALCHAMAAAELGIVKELMALTHPSSLRKQKETVVNNKTSILEEIEDKNPEDYEDVASELDRIKAQLNDKFDFLLSG